MYRQLDTYILQVGALFQAMSHAYLDTCKGIYMQMCKLNSYLPCR